MTSPQVKNIERQFRHQPAHSLCRRVVPVKCHLASLRPPHAVAHIGRSDAAALPRLSGTAQADQTASGKIEAKCQYYFTYMIYHAIALTGRRDEGSRRDDISAN